jgi:hypothetical protein
MSNNTIVIGTNEHISLMHKYGQNVRNTNRFNFCVTCWAHIPYYKLVLQIHKGKAILKPSAFKNEHIFLKIVQDNNKKWIDKDNRIYTKPNDSAPSSTFLNIDELLDEND